MTDNKIPSLSLSIVLLLFLMVPYGLKLFYSEPYPAIILPSGHTKHTLKDSSFCAPAKVIQAVNINSMHYENVPLEDFFDPAPVRLLAYWERNEFGLKKSEDVQSRNDSLRLDEAKLWFKMKLNKMGYLADHFKLLNLEYCFDKNSKAIINSKVLNQKTYELD